MQALCCGVFPPAERLCRLWQTTEIEKAHSPKGKVFATDGIFRGAPRGSEKPIFQPTVWALLLKPKAGVPFSFSAFVVRSRQAPAFASDFCGAAMRNSFRRSKMLSAATFITRKTVPPGKPKHCHNNRSAGKKLPALHAKVPPRRKNSQHRRRSAGAAQILACGKTILSAITLPPCA